MSLITAGFISPDSTFISWNMYTYRIFELYYVYIFVENLSDVFSIVVSNPLRFYLNISIKIIYIFYFFRYCTRKGALTWTAMVSGKQLIPVSFFFYFRQNCPWRRQFIFYQVPNFVDFQERRNRFLGSLKSLQIRALNRQSFRFRILAWGFRSKRPLLLDLSYKYKLTKTG